MAIRRAKDFTILIIEKADELKEKLKLPADRKGKVKWDRVNLTTLIDESGEIIFEELTEVLNFLFEYRNEDYEPLTVKWVEENMSIRILKEILLEVARQNELSWLPPFFQSRFKELLKKS